MQNENDYCTFNQVLTLTIFDPDVAFCWLVGWLVCLCLRKTISSLVPGMQLLIWQFFFFLFT